jgi:hypothetical protein
MNSNLMKLLGAVTAMLAAAAFFSMLPDLKRYIKLERM